MLLKTQMLGRVGKDAEVKEIGENSVINFSVAHTEKWKKGDQEQERTTWVNCSVWRKKDRTGLAQYIKKGNLIYIEGEPSARAYKNQDGEAVGSLELRVTDLKLIPSGGSQSSPGEAKPKESKQDDLPF